jgi:catalase
VGLLDAHAGERFWVKYKSVQGIENLTLAEAAALAGEDPDFHRRDLWETIAAPTPSRTRAPASPPRSRSA